MQQERTGIKTTQKADRNAKNGTKLTDFITYLFTIYRKYKHIFTHQALTTGKTEQVINITARCNIRLPRQLKITQIFRPKLPPPGPQ